MPALRRRLLQQAEDHIKASVVDYYREAFRAAEETARTPKSRPAWKEHNLEGELGALQFFTLAETNIQTDQLKAAS